MPPPVRMVEIAKSDGSPRVRGVPTVADRIAQTVVAAQLELYPDVVDACEEEGGVPSRLLKTDAGVGRQEGTPWRMFAGSLLGRASRVGARLMVWRARVRVG